MDLCVKLVYFYLLELHIYMLNSSEDYAALIKAIEREDIVKICFKQYFQCSFSAFAIDLMVAMCSSIMFL